MADLQKLEAELLNDPLGRGYSQMSDQQILTSLNLVNRTVLKTSIAAGDLVKAIIGAEFEALAQAKRDSIQLLVSAGSIDPSDGNVRAIFTSAFGAGTTTRANLSGLQNSPVNRLTELGIGEVHLGDIATIRK